jgi:hypothetical protein
MCEQGGTGRDHSQASTVAMHAMANTASHARWAVNETITAHAAMVTVALHLARRLTVRPFSQLCSSGPNRRWFSSQACRRGELRAAAQAAIRMNTVVGMPGTTTPMSPSTRHSTAKA